MPWDSTAQREAAELGNEGADTRAAMAARYAAAQNELGFGSGAANPYSRTAENKESLAGNQRGITTSAGNQLYAGSTLNAQSAARTEFDKRRQAIEAAIGESQIDYDSGVSRTQRDEALGLTGIKEGAIGRAAESEPAPLAVGRGRSRATARTGRGRPLQPVRPRQQGRAMNALSRQMGGGAARRGRGRF